MKIFFTTSIVFFLSSFFFPLLWRGGGGKVTALARATARLFWILILLAVCRVQSVGQTPGEWTWMHGDNTPNSIGVFGTQGVANSANKPPALYEPCEWKDNNGNFWLFGGQRSGSNTYAALWKYDPNPSSPTYNQWTWMQGPSAPGQTAVYGIQGVSSPANHPGSRGGGTVTWVDASGNLWLFGGSSGAGNFNDLWKYDPNPASPTYNQWTWIKGPSISNDPGSYGTIGVQSATNLPPSRYETSCSWTDNSGNLWLYGGVSTGIGTSGDLWKYNIAANEWTWMHGATTFMPPAVYGTQGTAAPANTPGGRIPYASWTGLTGDLWMFGGASLVGTQVTNNDLWKYNIAANEWTWMKGPSTFNDPGNYGTKCVSAGSNVPPSRMENRARVRDACGNFWNFGGYRYGVPVGSCSNDLWHYNVSTNQWTWVSGDNIPNQPAVFGALTISAPTNKPGAKHGNVAWVDNNGYIWLFGGGSSPGSPQWNDLFRYVPAVLTISSSSTICNGQSTTLTASGGTNYTWSPGGQSTSSIVVSPTTSTSYAVTGSIGCVGCGSTSVTVTVISGITTSQSASICTGTTYTLPSGTVVSTSGIYIDTLTSAAGCDSIITTTLTVNPLPTVIISPNVTIAQGMTITLTAGGGGTYLWSTGDVTQNIIVSPIQTTTYCITVTDNNGCITTACVTVTVEFIDCSYAEELYLPNAFSPNQDGENDEFCLQGSIEDCIKELKIIIYDRWGEKVYESTDKNFCWDGIYNGKIMNPSVFVYYVDATLINGKQMSKKGNISLVR